MTELLSKDHTILERPFMEFRPFGVDEQGKKIDDVGGVAVKANVEHLAKCVARTNGADAGKRAIEELCRLLNGRISDPAYHVTPEFLGNHWNSYGAEFVAYLREFCIILSGDPEFSFKVGREQHLALMIQILARPFSLRQIYNTVPYFSAKFAKGALTETVKATSRYAIIRRKFTERTNLQYGPYRKRCADLICQAFKGTLIATPEQVHHLPPATVRDRTCIANGDEWCEWEVTWIPSAWWRRLWPASGSHRDEPSAETGSDHRTAAISVVESQRVVSPHDEPALLSKEHTILERKVMEFPPFGMNPDGTKVHDATGVKIRAFVDYLEEYMDRTRGQDAGPRAVQELCRLLNERIPDSTRHVDPQFLKNNWNSYSYEFMAYLGEFCKLISGDPLLPARVGEEKFISAVIQALGRPFPLEQIYRMFPHFGEKFSSLTLGVVEVTQQSARLTMQYPESVSRQFGPYRLACTELVCQSAKNALAAVPEKVHHMPRATVKDLKCVARGDDRCEWELTWTPEPRYGFVQTIRSFFSPSAPHMRISEPPATAAGQTVEQPQRTDELLPKEHRILERPFMEFQPYGVDERGNKIRDISGAIVKANVDQLEDAIARLSGPRAGLQAVEELCRLLNERIPDPACHVTPAFLKNAWNSYSYEFVSFLREFCEQLSGDPYFHYHVGQGRHLSPIIQALGRPFPMSQIFKLWPHFAEKFAKGSVICEVGDLTDHSAVLRLKFAESSYRQFGPFRKACARLTCEASKGGISMVPNRVHNLSPATVRDRTCIVDGDEWCEWEVTWSPQPRQPFMLPVGGLVASGSAFAYLRTFHPAMTMSESLGVALIPALMSWAATRMSLQARAAAREALIQEQVQVVEARHEELREVYLEQEQTQVELRRRVNQLTTLHQAGLLFGATFDRETLLQNVLKTLIHQLHYDHAMISLFDPERRVAYDSRLFGAPEEAAAYARSHEVTVTDPNSPEGLVLLQGRSLLVADMGDVWNRLHPRNQQLVSMLGTKSLISVPIKSKDRIFGSMSVDRTREHGLAQEDLDLLVTLASQVATALDNTEAYRQIEQLNIGLEAKVRERTTELERLNEALKTANEQLQELDRLKGDFFANISHEFRTPLTLSLASFKELRKLVPATKAREQINMGMRNTARLLYLVNEFLDLAKFDRGLLTIKKLNVDFAKLVRAVAANFESSDRRRIHLRGVNEPMPLEADPHQMKKVLYNLLSNAIKFSDPDTGEVWIRLATKGDQVELEVEDNGIGIPRDQLDRIFERFAQVERRATRREEGTGIGLALVKEIVTQHGGTVAVESEVGHGSTFTVSLPRGAASVATIVAVEDDDTLALPVVERSSSERAIPKAGPRVTGGERPLVLVAEDNADMRAYLERLLVPQYRVVLAKDGAEALEQAKRTPPDLILTDVMMPRMCGNALLKAVREDQGLREIPVVFLTAKAGTEARVESLEAGANDYIPKPFDEQEILARVSNLIRLRAQEHEVVALQREKLARFMPAQLADVIFSDRADEVLKSHRAEITVAFIDLRGFTSFAETAEPEDVMTVLQDYQAEMGRLITEHHGVIERFSGDAIMIFFNDPVPVPNHAEQAVRLAIAMRSAVEGLKHKWRQRGTELGAGIGVATGYATLGLVGFEQRNDYAAIGAVTNLAARLCGEARHGQILISERVRHFVKDLVHAESVGTLTLKGFQKPVQAYNVAGLREPRPAGGNVKTKKGKRG
jgi:signal transduction histidine kinase/class 3 adenylate cyclase